IVYNLPPPLFLAHILIISPLRPGLSIPTAPKPFDRLGSICEGRKSKDDVLQYHLQKYKNLFQRAVRMAIQLDQSLAVRLEQPAVEITEITGSLGEMASLSGHSQSNLDNQSSSTVARCPSCGRGLVLRQRRPSQQQQRQQHPLSEVNTNQVSTPSASTETNTSNSWFLSCTGFPLCRYAVWFPDCIIGVRIAPDSNNPAGHICPRCASNSTTSDTSSSGDIPSRGPLKLAFRLRRNMRLPNGYMQDELSKE
ncbi:DNA topoisomerase, partial [Fasciola gigantica]